MERMRLQKLLNDKAEREIIDARQKDKLLNFYTEQMSMLLDNLNKKSLNSNKFNSAFVISKLKNAYNFEDLMAPALTDEEKEFLLKDSAESGCYKLLRNRCVDGIEIDKRPIHLVDPARKKYLIYTNNEWKHDDGGNMIVESVLNKVKGYWMVDITKDSNEVMEQKAMRMMECIRASKKILSYINEHITLKNNVGFLLKKFGKKHDIMKLQ
jgi:Rps23 Pro-64 3,4-dihydroxylase Tpa1-like proline 4-hydroxylase